MRLEDWWSRWHERVEFAIHSSFLCSEASRRQCIAKGRPAKYIHGSAAVNCTAVENPNKSFELRQLSSIFELRQLPSITALVGGLLMPWLLLLTGVFPDTHLACNTSCKIDWTREWIRAHLRDATRMNKPLVLGGIGALRPQKWRLEVLRVVREEIERALQRGNPIGGEYFMAVAKASRPKCLRNPAARLSRIIASNCSSQRKDVRFLLAGFILSGLSHPDMPDAPGWSVYYTSKGVHSARLPVSNLNTQVGASLRAPDLGC